MDTAQGPRVMNSTGVPVERLVNATICPNPVFVIGSPRSGTSALAWSLAQHPDFWTSAESDFLHHLVGPGHLQAAYHTAASRSDGGWLSQNAVTLQEFLSYVGLGFNALFTSRSGGRRWIDQSPTYTLLGERILDLFPSARIVHIVRDGRETVHSMVNSGFSTHWAENFEEACAAWAHYVKVGLALMDARADAVITVNHRELASDPSDVLGRVFDFLDATPSREAVTFAKGGRINSSFGASDRLDGEAIWETWDRSARLAFVRAAAPIMLQIGFDITDVEVD